MNNVRLRLTVVMEVANNIRIEYCVQANGNVWYNNSNLQKVFKVGRDDQVKEINHLYPTIYNINECVGHNQCCHKNCEALNGKFWIDKIV